MARARLHMLLGGLLLHCSSANVRDDRRAVCWPSLTGIGETFGFPPRTIRRYLCELEATGVVEVLCGSAVGEQDRGDRQTHDGGFVSIDGIRISTSARAYQFVFTEPCESAPSVTVPPAPTPSEPAVPVVVAPAPLSRSYLSESGSFSVSAVPRLPAAKRTEIEAEIGAEGCVAMVAWVASEWDSKPGPHGRPFDFWNARLAEWREREGSKRATSQAQREIAETAQRARPPRGCASHSR